MEKAILIKGMVCHRCISAIKSNIEKFGPWLTSISLGKLTLHSATPTSILNKIEQQIIEAGFEVIEEKNQRLVNHVKLLVDELIEHPERKQKLSSILSDKLNLSYEIISEQFSIAEGQTLEKYLIQKRINKAQEAISNTNKTFTQIAHELGFSSINHFSRQFKDITGQSPTELRNSLTPIPSPKERGIASSFG